MNLIDRVKKTPAEEIDCDLIGAVCRELDLEDGWTDEDFWNVWWELQGDRSNLLKRLKATKAAE